MKNKIVKKIISGSLIISLIASIGVVIVNANTDENDEENDYKFGFRGRNGMFGKGLYFSELTDDQREEIKEMEQKMIEEGKTPEEIRDAIQQKLEIYDIEIPSMQDRIEIEIEKTEKRFEILEYIKELLAENPDLTKDEIIDLVQTQFDIELPELNEYSMNFHHDHRHGFIGKGCEGLEDDFSFNKQAS